jgi:hypothetical protein
MSHDHWEPIGHAGAAVADEHEALTFHPFPLREPGLALESGEFIPAARLGQPVAVRPRLIGVVGVARSGKSTIANYLVSRHGFVQHSFAAPLRAFVASILGWSLDELEARKEEPIPWLAAASGLPSIPNVEWIVTPRYMMQTVGTEWGRKMIDADIWVKSCMARVQHDLDAGRSVVISDVRFNNEAEVIRGAGGDVWQVLRNGAGTVSKHASENGVNPGLVTRFIPNNSTLGMLGAAIDYTLAHGEADAS